MRSAPGSSEREIPEGAPLSGLTIGKFVKHCEASMREWTPTEVLAGFAKAAELVGHKGTTVEENTEGKKAVSADHFGSVAFGERTHLSCHRDDDSFCCLVTLQCPVRDSCLHQMDDEIVAHFCFPECGVAVAMRPGDMTLFDPRVMHCTSSVVDETKQVHCVSLCLKTAVVGLNDNHIKLTKEQLFYV